MGIELEQPEVTPTVERIAHTIGFMLDGPTGPEDRAPDEKYLKVAHVILERMRPRIRTDQDGSLLCPIPTCTATLHLLFSASCSLGVGHLWPTELSPEDADARFWSVGCTDNHVIFDHVDAIRMINARDPQAELDETGDYAPTFSILDLLDHLQAVR